MQQIKYIIIGGGVAGTTAAETIRKEDPEGTIAIISDEPYRLYSRILLSKPPYFLGKIPADRVWLKDESWYEENKITLMTGKKATSLDSKKKILRLDDKTELNYEKLLLALGGCARKWPVPGSDKQGVFYLRTLDDGKAIMQASKTAKQAVLIGGGFISFEMADILRQAGLDVTLILRESYYWEPTLDETQGKMIEKALEAGGVKILRQTEVQEVLGQDKTEAVVLKDGTKIPCQMIVCGIGTACPYDQLRAPDLKINKGILANEYLETNLPDVWTAGDAAEYRDLILDETLIMGNWASAVEQGKVAGRNMAGKKDSFKFVSCYTTDGLGIKIAFVGDVRAKEDRQVIVRQSPEKDSYARLIIMNKELIGASLINRTEELQILAKLIESNKDVSGKLKELADPNFDIKSLL